MNLFAFPFCFRADKDKISDPKSFNCSIGVSASERSSNLNWIKNCELETALMPTLIYVSWYKSHFSFKWYYIVLGMLFSFFRCFRYYCFSFVLLNPPKHAPYIFTSLYDLFKIFASLADTFWFLTIALTYFTCSASIVVSHFVLCCYKAQPTFGFSYCIRCNPPFTSTLFSV